MKRCFHEGSALLGATFLQELFGDMAMAGANIIGAAINARTQNSNTRKMLQAQKEENEKAYQRNLEMWNLENAYNSPSEVVKRLQAAGMNPNLAYGIPNVSAPSPDAPITDMSAMANMKSPLGSALEESVNARYMNALIQNLESQSNKNNADAGLANTQNQTQLTYNQYQDQILKGTIQEQNAKVTLNFAEADLADAQSLESYRNCDRILADTREIYQNIINKQREYEIMGEDLAIKQIIRRYEEPIREAELKRLYSEVNRNNATAAKDFQEFKLACASFEYDLAIKKTASNNMFIEGLNMSLENDLLNVDVSSAIYEREHLAGTTAIRRISDLVGAFKDVQVGRYFGSRSSANRVEWTDTYDDKNNWTGRKVTKRRYD